MNKDETESIKLLARASARTLKTALDGLNQSVHVIRVWRGDSDWDTYRSENPDMARIDKAIKDTQHAIEYLKEQYDV